jgi:amino acid transporter
MAELNRSLGFWGATGIGIGAITGTGIFVLIGVASGIAGPAVILSFIIAGFGTLLTFFFINLSLLRLRKTMPDVKRGFKVPFYSCTPVFAMISCIVLSFYLNVNAVITACVFLAVGIVVYYLNKKGCPASSRCGGRGS